MIVVNAFMILLLYSFVNDGAAKRAPVVIVPGDMASPIDCKVTDQENCEKRTGWFRLWLRVEDVVRGRFTCISSNLRTLFNTKTNTSHSPHGVQTRVAGWGNTSVVEYLDPSHLAKLFHIGSDAAAMVQALVSWGYERDFSIRGAPYDFRYAMASQPEWITKLRFLIEDTWRLNNKTKVAIISHSMGGLFATWFLNQQSTSWKDKFVHCFVPLSTPWGGSIGSLWGMTSGYNLGIPIIKSKDLRESQRTTETNYMMIPDPRFYSTNVTFIETLKQNFSLRPKDIERFFYASGNDIGEKIYKKVSVENELPSPGIMMRHPMVKTYCFYGTGLSTAAKLIYDSGFPDSQPRKVVYSDGDGTISRESLSGCRFWQKSMNNDQRKKTENLAIHGVSHSGIFADSVFLNSLEDILLVRS